MARIREKLGVHAWDYIQKLKTGSAEELTTWLYSRVSQPHLGRSDPDPGLKAVLEEVQEGSEEAPLDLLYAWSVLDFWLRDAGRAREDPSDE